MLLLGLDTATAALSVAVADGHQVLAERSVTGGRRHAELLMPLAVEVLAAAGVSREQLAGVVVGVGPGPFTGLRVGVVTARMLGAVLGIPVTGVCSLDAIALEAVTLDPALTDYAVATDARRREVYSARYAAGPGGPVRVEGPTVGAPAELVARPAGPVAGEAAFLHPLGPAREPRTPGAGALCRWVASGLPTLPPVPLYLRRPDAVPPGPRKPVLA